MTFIKTASVTHSFNFEQRFMELTFTPNAGGLSVQAPSSAVLAPPGNYLLFVIDRPRRAVSRQDRSDRRLLAVRSALGSCGTFQPPRDLPAALGEPTSVAGAWLAPTPSLGKALFWVGLTSWLGRRSAHHPPPPFPSQLRMTAINPFRSFHLAFVLRLLRPRHLGMAVCDFQER